MHDPSKQADPNLSILMNKKYLPAVFFGWDGHSPDCVLLIPMDSPKCSWVLYSVHILTEPPPIQHPTFFLFGRSALSRRIRYFLPLPFFTRSLIVYLTLLPLIHTCFSIAPMSHHCVVYVPPSSQSFAPPLRSLV